MHVPMSVGSWLLSRVVMNPKDTLNPNAVFCHPGKCAKLFVNSPCAQFGVVPAALRGGGCEAGFGVGSAGKWVSFPLQCVPCAAVQLSAFGLFPMRQILNTLDINLKIFTLY